MKIQLLLPAVLAASWWLAGCGGRADPDPDPARLQRTEPAPDRERDDMAYIPGGAFFMGCSPGDPNCGHDERPRVRVDIHGFWMDKRPVTQGEYSRATGFNPSFFRGCGPDCPVEQVSWHDAKAYCESVGKRLPTEAEWEKAARGRTETPYPWGSGAHDEYAWFRDNSGAGYPGDYHGRGPQPVGLKQPNGFGLYDMQGNVMEWVQDCYDADWHGRLSPEADNPANLCAEGPDRVLRGGSWICEAERLRSSARHAGYQRGASLIFGFRCARD